MNSDFNVGFIHEQSMAEQLFNRASLREFHGLKVGDGVDQAVAHFRRSLEGLDAAIEKTGLLLTMLQQNDMLPEFEGALIKHLDGLGVNALPRVGRDGRKMATLEDILQVLLSEFKTLRDMTVKAMQATAELEPQIQKGLFVATILEAKTPFNEAKVSLGFSRGIVEAFMSTACHATIRASEENFPLGYEFLLEPKILVGFSFLSILLSSGVLVVWRSRRGSAARSQEYGSRKEERS